MVGPYFTESIIALSLEIEYLPGNILLWCTAKFFDLCCSLLTRCSYMITLSYYEFHLKADEYIINIHFKTSDLANAITRLNNGTGEDWGNKINSY